MTSEDLADAFVRIVRLGNGEIDVTNARPEWELQRKAWLAGRESLRAEMETLFEKRLGISRQARSLANDFGEQLRVERERSCRLYLLLKQVASGPMDQSLILRIDKILIDHEATRDE